MSLSRDRYKLPIVPMPTVRRGYDYDTPQVTEYEEVIFDYKTNRYLTLSQQREIEQLQDQLKEKETTRRKKLESIIGYYYKR